MNKIMKEKAKISLYQGLVITQESPKTSIPKKKILLKIMNLGTGVIV